MSYYKEEKQKKTGRKMAKIIFPVKDCESQNDLRNALSSFIVEELFNYFSCILHSIFAFSDLQNIRFCQEPIV